MFNIKPFLTLVLCSFFGLTTMAQTDSLILEVRKLEPDTNKVKGLQEIATELQFADRARSYTYADSAMQLAKELNYDHGIRQSNYLFATLAYYTGDFDTCDSIGKSTLEQSKKANDFLTQIMILNTLTKNYRSQFDFEKALAHIQEATAISRQIKDRFWEGSTLYTTATIYEYQAEYETAKLYLNQAVEIFKELNDEYKLGVAYQGMAVLSTGEEALGYAQKGYKILLKTEDIQGQGFCLWSIGDAYYEMGQLENALENYLKTEAIFERLGFPEGVASVQANIGLSLVKLGQYDRAKPYLDKSKAESFKFESFEVLETVYKGLSHYYAGKGEPMKSGAFVDSMSVIRDSLFNREKAQVLLESETRLRTKEKEAELIQKELEIQQQTFLTNTVLIGALVLFVILILIFLYLRNRQALRRRETEVALELERQKADQLKELDQLKSNFFANISHEFRTPLTVLLGPLKQMQEGTFKGNYQQYYGAMLRNGLRLQDLINQLLDLSKLESSKMELKAEPGDIRLYSRQIAGALESWAERKSIVFQLDIETEPLWVHFDKDKWQKILNNLLSNAFKFTPEGGRVIVQLSNTFNNNQALLRLEVKDTGPGIPEAELPRIFERFYQSQNQEDGMASSGIGLALTKELVHFCGGEIEVESQIGEGTIFIVQMPFATAQMGDDKTPVFSSDGALSEATLTTPIIDWVDKGAPTVLVVEDNSDVRQFIKDQLVADFQVLEAVDGEDGWAHALKHTPDLIVSDVMMPKLDGTAFAKRLKTDERTSHIPVIMLTAKAEQKDKLEGLETGADDYLIKPFDAEELRVRSKNLIQQRRKLQERFSQSGPFVPQNLVVSSVDERFLNRFQELVEAEIDNEQLSVEYLSSQLNMSRSQLHRKLKALTGQAPNVLVRTLRLQKARHLLEKQAGNVTEVAFMVGFSNLAYFSKCFKDAYGVSPTEFNQMRK